MGFLNGALAPILFLDFLKESIFGNIGRLPKMCSQSHVREFTSKYAQQLPFRYLFCGNHTACGWNRLTFFTFLWALSGRTAGPTGDHHIWLGPLGLIARWVFGGMWGEGDFPLSGRMTAEESRVRMLFFPIRWLPMFDRFILLTTVNFFPLQWIKRKVEYDGKPFHPANQLHLDVTKSFFMGI